jgi:DnaJ-class molecular chaperone
MRDPYEMLGVARSASAAEIKSAFRKLAKKLHPDANKHDPKAASRFAELNAAHEIIGDPDKRKAFDRGEIDAEGKPRFQGFEGFGQGGGAGGFGRGGGFETFSFGQEGFARGGGRGSFRGQAGIEDILKDVFGGLGAGAGGRGRGGMRFEEQDFAPPSHDVTASLTVTLAEAAKGARKRVQLPTGKEVDVKIPQGIGDGQQIRLKGQGLAAAAGSGPPGDLLITISLAPHPLFQREGTDLRIELPITLYEAVLGGKVRVPTLDGAVELAVPPATSSGRTFRLKGKGFPAKEGTGDLLATVRIVLPERPDPELEALMREWRDANTYNPRKDLE